MKFLYTQDDLKRCFMYASNLPPKKRDFEWVNYIMKIDANQKYISWVIFKERAHSNNLGQLNVETENFCWFVHEMRKMQKISFEEDSVDVRKKYMLEKKVDEFLKGLEER